MLRVFYVFLLPRSSFTNSLVYVIHLGLFGWRQPSGVRLRLASRSYPPWWARCLPLLINYVVVVFSEFQCGFPEGSDDSSWMDTHPCDSPLSPSTTASEVSSLDTALLIQQLLAASSSADIAAAHMSQCEDVETGATDGISVRKVLDVLIARKGL